MSSSSSPPTAANGVLSTPTTILQKNAPTTTPRPGPKSGPPKPKLKFVIRRLSPGLTRAEVEEALGEEWKVGGGKVDWASFRKGKVSTELAKHSKPSRYYLHLTDAAHVKPLADKVKQTPFNDARNTSKDSVLIGPPSLEYSLYTRTPGGRRVRHDARQGQIDQDPEYQDFLMSLTNPVNKPNSLENPESVPQKEEKVTTTPLIEHLREKKAAKDKPAAKLAAKHGRGESKEEKVDKKAGTKAAKDGVPTEKGKKLSHKEAAKEAVKVLNKEAANQSTAARSQENVPPAAPTAEKKRERGSTAAAKALLQRDLGIGPAATKSRRGAKRETPGEAAAKPLESSTSNTSKDKETSSAASSSATASSVATSSVATSSDKSSVSPESSRSSKKEGRFSRAERRAHKAAIADKKEAPEPTSGEASKAKAMVAPTILRKPASTVPASPTLAKAPPTAPKGPAATRLPSSPAVAPKSPAPVAAVPSTSTARQAFLKHANASQGITEPLIETALAVFGAIEKVEIDKRKGFAYVEFAEPEGLQKAIAASPVKIAQGAVQVLERKDRPPRKERIVPIQAPTGPPTAPRVISRGGGFAGRGRGGLRGGIAARGGRPNQGPIGENQATAAPTSAPTPPPAATSEISNAPPAPAAVAASGSDSAT